MRDYWAAQQDFLLLAVFLQMCTALFANGLASCNYPVAPGEEGTILQPNLISLTLVQNCLRLLGIVYILLVLPQPPQAGGSADTLQPVPPFRRAPLSPSALSRGSLCKRLCSIRCGLCRREGSGWVGGDAAATCKPAEREEVMCEMSCFLHPPFRGAEQREGETGEEVSGGGNLLVPSSDAHTRSGLSSPWGRSGCDGAIAQS